MPHTLTYKNTTFTLNKGESVLDCLLRMQINVPYACKSGACQSCMMQATDGRIPPASQVGLKPTYKQQNMFLACQCYPEGNLHLQDADGPGTSVTAHISAHKLLNHHTLQLRLTFDGEFPCHPGQYLTLTNINGMARSYSIANNPGKDGYIELHIRLYPTGRMGQWLANPANHKNPLTLRGPAGQCFYVPHKPNTFPIVLAGTGTGLSPLYGIINEALAHKHQGPITLFHGARNEEGLYLVDTLQHLAATHKNFRYVPCVLSAPSSKTIQQGHIQDIVLSHLPADKAHTHLYLCGTPETITPLKTQAFLAGIASKNIYVDAFLPSK